MRSSENPLYKLKLLAMKKQRLKWYREGGKFKEPTQHLNFNGDCLGCWGGSSSGTRGWSGDQGQFWGQSPPSVSACLLSWSKCPALWNSAHMCTCSGIATVRSNLGLSEEEKCLKKSNHSNSKQGVSLKIQHKEQCPAIFLTEMVQYETSTAAHYPLD